MTEQQMRELREKYDLSNDDLYMILIGEDSLDEILERRKECEA